MNPTEPSSPTRRPAGTRDGVEHFADAWLHPLWGYRPRLVVAAGGQIDYRAQRTFRARLATYADTGEGTAVLDLTEVAFLESAGLGTVLAFHNRLFDQRRKLHIAVTTAEDGPVRRLLRITGLTGSLRLHDDLPRALAAAKIDPVSRTPPWAFWL